MAIGISPALPLDYDQSDGPYRLTKSTKEAITQNFKNLILTNPGERIMDPDFGVGIKQYLFELETIDIQSDIIANIRQQARKYLNAVEVLDVRFSGGSNQKADIISVANSNALYVQILFRIGSLGSSNVLTLPILQNQGSF
tara:strand:+ start:3421 stop:3843 length:423 start_codon:yes stop_codon:yes gene_type:complete